ncbi:PulJ/GspJ family protein [Paenibacillus pinistramenti]|uniref:PulJ/GspJ family protein n=1 Tax=Paenibacillus pinistramenti TaxID=1768003 RepID=UPI0011087FB3|nr:prepilin-type N-terminal cleavage/methylation domain-containing protein [Paenibacillus pinistramenti]
MRKFADLLRREQGLTLVEMIAAITLLALVSGLVYAVMMFGLRSYHAVSTENTLRDEGDLLMSAVITELYTFAPETVTQTADGILLQRSGSTSGVNEEEIRITNGKMSIGAPSGSSGSSGSSDSSGSSGNSSAAAADLRTDITASLTADSGITLQCSNTGACDSGLIHIKLNLLKETGGKDFTLSLESRFGF